MPGFILQVLEANPLPLLIKLWGQRSEEHCPLPYNRQVCVPADMYIFPSRKPNLNFFYSLFKWFLKMSIWTL